MKTKTTTPRGKGFNQKGVQRIKRSSKKYIAKNGNRVLKRAQNGIKRDTIHNVLNSSATMFKDSPNSGGMYRRRRRNRRAWNQSQNKSLTASQDCLIIPDEPPEIISLLDTDDEATNNNTKAKRLDFNPKAGPSSAASKLRYPETEALTPFYYSTSTEEAPVIQIPLYETKNESIICLDDTVVAEPVTEQKSSESLVKYESILNNSDSVVVVEDVPEALEDGEIMSDNDFIPLTSGPKKTPKNPKKHEKRLVILDGNNIAMQHGNNKNFSVQGIEIAIKHFEDMGHEVKAIIPQFRMKLHKSTSQVLLEKLHNEGKVLLTPCKNLPGKMSSSYDDRFILEVAEKCDGAIISNDNYKDLLNEKPEWHKIITSRVIGFMFCGDNFFVPNDPYGKHGPKLHTILNKSPKPIPKH